MKWAEEELRRIAETDDLQISPFREDGVSTARPRGFGPSWSTTACTCAATTERRPAGIRPRFDRKGVAFVLLG